MEPKNVIAAISLSAAVIILYGLFFAPTPRDKKIQSEKENSTKFRSSKSWPNLEYSEITREEAIKDSERVTFENNNIKDSLSLNGGIIDDLFLKVYQTLNGNDK